MQGSRPWLTWTRATCFRRFGVSGSVRVCSSPYGLALAFVSPAGFPRVVNHGSFWPYLADAPLGEDAFYACTVAWHFTGGHGIVYNHELPTTGIQPGVTFVYAALAWLVQLAGGDQFLFCRIVLALNLLAILLLAHHAGALGRRIADVAGLQGTTAYWTTFAIVCSSCHVFNTFGYGLETGVYAVLVCWIARQSVEMIDADRTAVPRSLGPSPVPPSLGPPVRRPEGATTVSPNRQSPIRQSPIADRQSVDRRSTIDDPRSTAQYNARWCARPSLLLAHSR